MITIAHCRRPLQHPRLSGFLRAYKLHPRYHFTHLFLGIKSLIAKS